MAQVIELPIPEEEYFVTCPQCGGGEWYLKVDAPESEYRNLEAFCCAHCGFLVELDEIL